MQENGEAEKQKLSEQETLIEQLKVQWKQLWSERFNDKIRAEGVSANDYEKLRVEKGTIIHATRDFKPLNFKEILDENHVLNAERHITPNNTLGGWNKFVKTQITNKPRKHEVPETVTSKKTNNNQSKKGGRGWLHKK